ncbi:protein TIC 40, chloroplastic-like isoform X1 [Primulina eburnea]|uniref:protein TIC 40, chloroplastic-like isoform X1 n=1 Tax=Primulina eburnea TaxID=1245227 RepID=UPI003C6C1DDB
MDNLSLVSYHKIGLGLSPNPRKPLFFHKSTDGLANSSQKTGKNAGQAKSWSSLSAVSLFQGTKATKIIVQEKVVQDCFASITSSSVQQTSSVGANPQISVPPPPSQVGSPLFWIGVGVGLSALFSWLAGRTKKYAMEQAFKTFTQQMNAQNNASNNASFSPGAPSPFPFPPATFPTADSARKSNPVTLASQPLTVNVPATNLEEPPSVSVNDSVEPKKEQNGYAFVDVYPEETFRKNAFESYRESVQTNSHNDPQASQSDSLKGMSSKQGTGASKVPFTGNANSLLSVEALEKMMEDPTAQKMIFPYLPEEMRNPATFKWMLQNPQYRQQLQDMLNNMGGSPEWDNRMAESLKSFDLNSPEIKQQFDEIGLTPEEAITKIMANPDVAMAFQNPRVQAAITECSQNPLNIAKYQNDKEVMDVFNKIAELFPGVAGSS